MSEYHNPVMLQECIDGLKINPNGVYVDVTFGGGGHSKEILKRLKKGKLVAFDQDKDAINNLPSDKHLVFVHHNFRYLNRFLKYHQIEKINGLLADLGVSSHHFDKQERGFSFRFDAELDMRMNQNSEKTAADVLNDYSENELLQIFRQYGELKNAGKLAKVVCNARSMKSFTTINSFVGAIDSCLPKKNINTYLAKVFQALRIEINDELETLKEMLKQAKESLISGGRLVVISYHSLEDRLVKNFIRTGNFEGKLETDLYGNPMSDLKQINRSVIVPGEDEIKINNRARSAKLRIAEKI